MSTLEKMPGHTRLYRRSATYYHRAAIPKDIADTYPKSEETFSLRTKDHQEALRLVKIKAVEVDQRFEDHRRWLEHQSGPMLDELTQEQIQSVKAAYNAHILDEDEQERLEVFYEPDSDELPEAPNAQQKLLQSVPLSRQLEKRTSAVENLMKLLYTFHRSVRFVRDLR